MASSPRVTLATIDSDGYMQITDRSKDVIKSGGEWIELHRAGERADGPPGRARGRSHCSASPPSGMSVPLRVVVKKPDAEVSKEELLAFFKGKIPELADTGRHRVRGRVAAHGHGQAVQAQAARAVPRSQAADGLSRRVTFPLQG